VPSRDFYRNSDQPQTRVAIRRTLDEDLYLVLGGWEGNGETATFKVFVNPLVNWIWLGGLIVVLGILIAAWPEARRQTVPVRVGEGVAAK